MWNRRITYEDKEGEDKTAGTPDDDIFPAEQKQKQNAGELAVPNFISPEAKPIGTPNPLAVPIALPPVVKSNITDPGMLAVEQISWAPPLHSFRSALIDRWFGSLQRIQEEKRAMSAHVLHAAKNLRGDPEVVWKGVFYYEEAKGGADEDVNMPWASWGMRSVKEAKWEDLMKDEGLTKRNKVNDPTKPAGIARERSTPWSIIQRISKQKLFAIDMNAFEGEYAKS